MHIWSENFKCNPTNLELFERYMKRDYQNCDCQYILAEYFLDYDFLFKIFTYVSDRDLSRCESLMTFNASFVLMLSLYDKHGL